MEPITLAILGAGALLGLWALTAKKPAGAPGSAEVDKLASLVSTTGPKGERVFFPENAKNLLVQLASSIVTTPDPTNPAVVEYATNVTGKPIATDLTAFGWVSRENKNKSILAPLYAVTTAATTQRKFLRSVEPGTELELAGPNGIYAVVLYAGALNRKEQAPGTPPGLAAPPAPPKPVPAPPTVVQPPQPAPVIVPPAPAPGPIPPLPNVPVIQPVVFNPPTQPQPAGQPPLPPVPSQDSLPMGPAIVTTQTDPLFIRSAPSTTASIRGSAPKGATVLVTGPMQAGMAPVQYGAISGFSYGGYLRALAAPQPAVFVPGIPGIPMPSIPLPSGPTLPAVFNPPSPTPAGMSASVSDPSGAKVRSSPSSAVTTNVLGVLARGSTVTITGPGVAATGENWVPVTIQTLSSGSYGGVRSGTTGFMASRLLSAGGASAGAVTLNRIARAVARARKKKAVKVLPGW